VEPVILLRVVKVFYPAEGMGFTFGPAEIRRTEVPCGRAARNLQCKEFLFLLSIFADPAARLRGLHSLGIFKCEVGRREVQLVSLKRRLEGLKKMGNDRKSPVQVCGTDGSLEEGLCPKGFLLASCPGDPKNPRKTPPEICARDEMNQILFNLDLSSPLRQS